MKKVGILGGMGPRATVRFEQLLLDYLNGGDEEIPPILVINDGSIPSRPQFLVNNGEDPVPKMNRSLSVLLEWGADIVAMPCNTACAPAIFDKLSDNSRIVHLPGIVHERIHEAGYSEALLFATRGTIQAEVYQSSNSAIDWYTPSEPLQLLIDGYIEAEKNSDAEKKVSLRDSIVASLLQEPRERPVVLGCTELSTLHLGDDIRTIDSLKVLAEYVAQRALI